MASVSSKPKENGATAILSALEGGGITHLFVNLGSDHPAFLAAFARQSHPNIRVITCPNEMNALSAASGYAQITGKPAAVLVHVDCGTLGMAGAIHNVSKGRVPVVILAGTSPVTQEGELRGSRNEHIHWIQDVADQRAILRQYMRYDHEIRVASNAAQIVLRALQFATSSPRGPTYLIASREALEQPVESGPPSASIWGSRHAGLNGALEPTGLSPSAIEEIGNAILRARRPLIVTSYCGSTREGFESLRDLAELGVIAVHENAPVCNNFPTTSFLHQGHQWNAGGQLEALTEADLVVVVDSDVPWITTESRPNPSARIYHLDVDPLKEDTTLWYLPCVKRWKCDSALALRQVSDYVRACPLFHSEQGKAKMTERSEHLHSRFARRMTLIRNAAVAPEDGSITVPYFMSCFRILTRDYAVIGLNESTTNLGHVADGLGHSKPLSLFGSGGGSLGWCLSASVGVSLSLQERYIDNKMVIVAFSGDGTWLFGVPSSAYWMACKYNAPFLTVIWNNGGWTSPQNACLRLNPDLKASAGSPDSDGAGKPRLSERFNVTIDPSPNFGMIAEGAGDAWWRVVEKADAVHQVIGEALQVIQTQRRCAVIEVRLKRL